MILAFVFIAKGSNSTLISASLVPSGTFLITSVDSGSLLYRDCLCSLPFEIVSESDSFLSFFIEDFVGFTGLSGEDGVFTTFPPPVLAVVVEVDPETPLLAIIAHEPPPARLELEDSLGGERSLES